MEFIDYYKILNLSKDASQEDIKKSYRKLARKYHPDLHPNDKQAKEKFQQLSEAQEVLGDPEKRKKYDIYGENWKHADAIEAEKKRQQTQTSRSDQQTFSGSDYSSGDYSDFFESIFGGSKSSNSSKMQFGGRNLNATLNLNLSNILKPSKQTFEINNKKIRVTIPAGVEDGQTIKLTGFGEEGSNGGPNGDLYITFKIKNDINFKRHGDTLYTTVPIDITTAVLGGEVFVDTLQGKVKLQVKSGTDHGTRVKLKNKGFVKYKEENSFGDLIVSYKIKIPSSLSEKERDLFTQLKQEQTHA